MSAISDFFSKVLGKQDETLSAVGSLKGDFDLLKASASEKDSKITALQARVDELTAALALETGKSQQLETALSAEKAAHAATAESVEAKASMKAAEITATLGQAPVPSTPNPTPATEKKDLSNLHGLEKVAAAIRRDLGIQTK